MKPKKDEVSTLTNELENIAAIRNAENAHRVAVEKARQNVANKITAALRDADSVKEQVIRDARAERKRIVQQAIEQAKQDSQAIVQAQIQESDDLVQRGQEWVNSVADFAVNYILSSGEEETR